MNTVLLVEDQSITRDWLVQAINSHPSLELAAVSSNFSQAQVYLERNTPDVVLTDINLPDGNGIDLILQAQKHVHCQSMVITAHGDEQNTLAALQAGAQGYLLKNSDSVQIGVAIVDMLEGGSPLSPSIARYVLKQVNSQRSVASESENQQADTQADAQADTQAKTQRKYSDPYSDNPGLTKRELEVLSLIAKGHSYGDIAELLFLSIHTVNAHIKNLYRKLAVGSRGAAVFEATQMGLLHY